MKITGTATFYFFAIVLGILTTEVLSHSYLTAPISRSNQKQNQGGCRGPSCLGPCDGSASKPRTPITVSRGASINLQWPRNNHAGGFIRVAWAPTAQSDSHTTFDNNVQQFSCHERGGCKPDSASDPNGGDSAPADGSGVVCQLSITVPGHLTDGAWTLQWAWFGGAFQLGDYYSCVDYTISGGASSSKQSAFFVGGDYAYPNQQKCKFFNTDRLHQCVNEPCNNPVYQSAKEQSGAPYGISATTPPPSNPPPTTPVTTSRRQSVTTGTRQPESLTTGSRQQQSVTTGTGQTNQGSTTTAAATSGAMCYKQGTPNLGGKIHRSPPICGINGDRYRCAAGQCCSQFGYCGPIRETDGNYYDYASGSPVQISYAQAQNNYCNNSSYADYRKFSCESLGMTEEDQKEQSKEEESSGYDDTELDAIVETGPGNFIQFSVGFTFVATLFATLFA